jgi:bifunctional enzyme CysN/CysC
VKDTSEAAERQLLRFLTAGSVDDGKSTLVGRLLHDTNSIFEDQFAAIRMASAAGGNGHIDFSMVTDGLRAEREQGITIDVAHRYFSTARRKFIIADAPGHEQFTRNMATAASTASAMVLLLDARQGVLTQTQRHAVIAWLLGIRKFIIAVNKMDLAEFDERVFRKIERDLSKFIAALEGTDAYFIPTCSIDGDNVVRRSTRIPWFRGRTVLEYLETIPASPSLRLDRLRLPVQYVIRRHGEARRFAGQVASGVLRRGDPIRVLPSSWITTVESIRVGNTEVDAAFPPLSVAIRLGHEFDISRGDMFASVADPPAISRRFTATLLWLSHQPLQTGRPYLLKHTARHVCASVTRVKSVLDPASLVRRPADQLTLNQFGEVEIETHQPLYFDSYAENRMTGAFIVIDPITNGTLGAGMIGGSSALETLIEAPSGAGLTVWFTGLSSAGKSSISQAVHEKLWAMEYKVELLDGDVIRQHLNRGLGFTKEDRDENVRRMGFVAELLTRNGVIALVSAISPYRSIRDEIRRKIGNFLEVYVHASLETCEQRDLKGVYRRARAGEMHGVTGVDDPYEPPLAAEVECHTDHETLAESSARVLSAVLARLAQRVQSK